MPLVTVFKSHAGPSRITRRSASFSLFSIFFRFGHPPVAPSASPREGFSMQSCTGRQERQVPLPLTAFGLRRQPSANHRSAFGLPPCTQGVVPLELRSCVACRVGYSAAFLGRTLVFFLFSPLLYCIQNQPRQEAARLRPEG